MPGTILIVDDEPRAVSEMTDFFRRKGIQVVGTSDSRKALGIVAHSEAIHGVITDLKMPGVDGFEILAMARERALVFVAAITGHATEADEERARMLGAAHFFPKPLDLAAILRALNIAWAPLRPADCRGEALHEH